MSIPYRKRHLKARKPSESMQKRYHYDRVTEMLFRMFGDEHRYRVDEFREKVVRLRDKHRKAFREYLEYVFNDGNYIGFPTSRPRKSWREIKFTPKSYRQCKRCGRVFYDLSGNGRTEYCHYVIAEKWNGRRAEIVRKFNEDLGVYVSVCQRERDNAKARKSENQKQGVDSDGYKPYTPATRRRKEFELFIHYDPVPDADDEEAMKLLFALEGQMADYSGEMRDPQDIVCKTPPTHNFRGQPKTPQRWHRPGTYKQEKLAEYYEGTAWAFTVNVKTGEKAVHDVGLYGKYFEYSED